MHDLGCSHSFLSCGELLCLLLVFGFGHCPDVEVWWFRPTVKLQQVSATLASRFTAGHVQARLLRGAQ